MNKKFKLNKVDNGYMLLEESSIGNGCFVLVATEKDKLDELNCDELFASNAQTDEKRYTIEDLVKVVEYSRGETVCTSEKIVEEFLQDKESEIMVELVTEPMNMDEIRAQGKGFLNANTNKPKLTAEGKWILKRV